MANFSVWIIMAIIAMIYILLGMFMPPVGIILFVPRGISGDVPMKKIVYGAIPIVGVILANAVLIYFFPEIVTWLPSK